jgi:hypothetical protein
MKRILIFLFIVIFIFLSFEILLQINYYVLFTFNKISNKNFQTVQNKKQYKLKLVETFVDINKYLQSKSIKMVN